MPPSTPRSERTVLLDDLTVDVGPTRHAQPPPSGAAAYAAAGAGADAAADAGDNGAAHAGANGAAHADGDRAPDTARQGADAEQGTTSTSSSTPAAGTGGQPAPDPDGASPSDAAEEPAADVDEQPAADSRRARRREKRQQRRADRAQRREGGGEQPMPGATEVVEAATAEQAISQVHDTLGANAQILDAKLVRRGGFAGFFAREVVQLHVAPGEPASGADAPAADATGGPAPASPGVDLADTGNVRRHWITGSDEVAPGSAAASPGGRGLTDGPDDRSPVDRLLDSDALLDADSGDFATFLRRHLGTEADEAPVAASGSTNGSANGSANGSTNGSANGSTNGSANGSSAAPSATDQQGPRTWAEYLQSRQGTVGAPVAWPQLDPEGCEVLRPLPADDAPDPSGTPAADPTPATVKFTAPVVDAESEPAPTGQPLAPDPREDAGDRPVDLHDPPADGAATGATRRGGSLVEGAAAAPSRPADTSGPDAGGVSRTAVALVRLGLPRTFVDTIAVDEPFDDLAWITALTGALRQLCGPLPDRPSVMVGPLAPTVAEGAGVPTASSALWLRSLRAQRWVHLVVGGDGWRDWLDEEPEAVSWARPEDLPEAIRCAAELGLRLGFGPLGGTVRAAHPLDVALALRELVDAR